MLVWDYLHDIEYRREIAKGKRIHEYTERADDMGFCFSRRPEDKQRWLVEYTHACAVDFFERVRAAAGTWVVSVYRTFPDKPRKHVVTIRMRWPAKTQPAQIQPGKPQSSS